MSFLRGKQTSASQIRFEVRECLNQILPQLGQTVQKCFLDVASIVSGDKYIVGTIHNGEAHLQVTQVLPRHEGGSERNNPSFVGDPNDESFIECFVDKVVDYLSGGDHPTDPLICSSNSSVDAKHSMDDELIPVIGALAVLFLGCCIALGILKYKLDSSRSNTNTVGDNLNSNSIEVEMNNFAPVPPPEY